MGDFINEYIRKVELGFDEAKRDLDALKLKFQSTRWEDVLPMIDAANEIWTGEGRLKDAMEIHKIILENYREG